MLENLPKHPPVQTGSALPQLGVLRRPSVVYTRYVFLGSAYCN